MLLFCNGNFLEAPASRATYQSMALFPKQKSPVTQPARTRLKCAGGSAGFRPVRVGILPRRSEDLDRMSKSASKMLALPNQKRLAPCCANGAPAR